MKICIDAGIGLGSSEKGGIYYLLPEFLNALSEIDKKNDYLIFGYFLKKYRKKVKEIKRIVGKNFKVQILPLSSKLVKICEKKIKIYLIESILNKQNVAIYHSLSATYLPFFKKIKTIYTIHDLSFEIMPYVYKEKWYSEIKNSALRADIILVPSFSTKKDIVEIYKIPEEKIKVLYLGVNKDIFKPIEKDISKMKLRKYFDEEKYILTVATSIKRKNLPFLLDVYAALKEKNIEEKLVIIAGSNSLKKEILNLIKQKNLEKCVYCFAEIPEDDLPYFYSAAELFVFLSLYEGFGLPVVEAMSCGVPVIVSNISSLPEIVKDAGICISPYDKDEAVGQILKVINDSDLKSKLKEKGLERSKLFDWKKFAESVVEIYEKLIK